MTYSDGERMGQRSGTLADMLRDDFAELVRAQPIALSSVARGELDEVFEPLLGRAMADGWSREQAVAALQELAREYEGARGASFD